MYSIELCLVLFQLFVLIETFLYPCEYTNQILRCDLCQCYSLNSSNFCSLTQTIDCQTTNVNEELLLRSKIDRLLISNENQIEFHHFNNEILQQNEFCLIKNSSQLTFFNLSLKTFSNCLLHMKTVRFINSLIENDYFLSENLIFYNSTLTIPSLRINSTKRLILHTIHHPIDIHSLSSLIHLTIIQTEHFHLHGFFPHLIDLELSSTNLTDRKLNKIFTEILVPDLTRLILSNNRLTIVTNRFPSTIRYLDLSKNQIKSLDYYSFKSLYSLNSLNLSFNSPLEIQQDTFTRIPYLELLDLTSIYPTLPFDELFLPLQKLRFLNISANLLDSLPSLPSPLVEHFNQELPTLFVDLSKNQFDRLDFDLLNSLSNQDKFILSFDFQFNRIRTVNLLNETYKRGPLIEFNLNQNPFECDCNFYRTMIDTRFKFINSTCQYPFDPSTVFCSYKTSCPTDCSCQYSFDLQINRVNCSYRQLKQIPMNLPLTTTHLYLNHNRIQLLEYMNLTQLKLLDLSSNEINWISFDNVRNLVSLEELYLHNNSWLITNDLKEFQLNKHLRLLTYANGFLCNRTKTMQRILTIDDCCQLTNGEHRICSSKEDSSSNEKYFLSGGSIFLVIIILFCIGSIYCWRKCLLLKKSSTMEKRSNQSLSYTDEDDDDYASIPISFSPVIHIPVKAPPLPPPRYFQFTNRPSSNSSTTSTSITIQSPSSCLQIKLDILVVYAIQDSELIHNELGGQLEDLYGKRYSFYFLHRDRMLGELDWLIENSCIVLLILSKPYQLNSDYMKIFSKTTSLKCFIILLPNPQGAISFKIREKIARLYQTSNIYEWNTDPNSLIHEQLELYLEQNCGAASYIAD